jgi:cobalt-zinc-cadmium efflux system outer membrane protein
MRKQAFVGALCAVLILRAVSAHGQTSQAGQYVDPEGGVSLATALAMAIEREPSLRAARSEAEAARGMRVQAGLRPNPTVSLDQRQQPGGSDNQSAVDVEWPLDLFRRKARVELADREAEATEQSVADRQRLLTSEVRSRYGQAAAAVRELATAETLAMSALRDLNLRRSRVDEGASPPLERDLLDVDWRMLESEQLMAIGKAEAAMIDLKRILGLPAAAPMKLRETLETLVAAADVTPTPASPPGERPDVREAEARVQVADARIDRARSDGRFDVSLRGSYMRMAAGFSQRGFNTQNVLEPVHGVFHYLAAGAMVTVPLRNRNQGEIAAAQAERAGAAAQLEAARLTAQAEVAAAVARENRARQALAVVEGAVALSRKNLDVVRQTFELGRTTALEVLAEQRRYLQIEKAHTAGLQAVFDARAALLRAQGEVR